MSELGTGDTAAPAALPAATASPAVTPEPVSSTPASATATPAAPITDNTGEPPKERWADILEHQRKTAREDATKEWDQQYGWAKSVKRDQLEQMANWYGRYTGDAGEFIETILQESLAHPVHGQSVKSRLGKMLSSLRTSQAPTPDIEPDIPVLNDQGQVVSRTYSADAMKQIIAKAVQEAIGRDVDPLKQDFQSRQASAKQQQQQDFITSESARIKASVIDRPQAKEHWPAIQAKARELVTGNDKLSAGEAVLGAYLEVVGPLLSQSAEADVLSDLQRKATAQTVHPGSPASSAKPKFKSFDEAAIYYAAHPDEAQAMANR